MSLRSSQQRELAQLLLVARAYLALGNPEDEGRATRLSETRTAFTSRHLGLADWSMTMKGAHLASAAIRLASIDDMLQSANEGRTLYRECRQYFGQGGASVPEDPRGSSCSEWFHVMLRDTIGHREPEGDAPSGLIQRYETRLRCVEATTFAEAHSRLEQTADELADWQRRGSSFRS